MRRPILQSLLLSDYVYVDRATNKKVIAGTFNRLTSEAYPTAHSQCFVYLSLTECTGMLALQLRLVELSSNIVVLDVDLQVDAGDDPLNSKEFVFVLNQLPFPRPGHYGVEVFWNNEQLGVLRLTLAQRNTEQVEVSDEQRNDQQ